MGGWVGTSEHESGLIYRTSQAHMQHPNSNTNTHAPQAGVVGLEELGDAEEDGGRLRARQLVPLFPFFWGMCACVCVPLVGRCACVVGWLCAVSLVLNTHTHKYYSNQKPTCVKMCSSLVMSWQQRRGSWVTTLAS